MKWLKKLEIQNTLYQQTLDEHMASYEEQKDKIERYDKRIEEIFEQSKYHDKVRKLEILRDLQKGTNRHHSLGLLREKTQVQTAFIDLEYPKRGTVT